MLRFAKTLAGTAFLAGLALPAPRPASAAIIPTFNGVVPVVGGFQFSYTISVADDQTVTSAAPVSFFSLVDVGGGIDMIAAPAGWVPSFEFQTVFGSPPIILPTD